MEDEDLIRRRQRESSPSPFQTNVVVFIIGLLSFLRLFSVELTSLKLKVFANNNTVSLTTSAAGKTKSTLHYHYHQYSKNNNTSQRSQYGYRRPRPPYSPIQHTSHTCIINRNTSSEEVIHLPIGVPHLILIGAQKSATSEFQLLADKRSNVITSLSAGKFETHFFDFHVQRTLMHIFREERFTLHNNDALTSSFFQIGPKSEKFNDTVCRFRQLYTKYFDMSRVASNDMSVVMEKTPSYMLYNGLPWIIDAVCPWKPKILVILRDPVDRAWSQYRMDLGRKKNTTNFAAKVEEEIDTLIAYGLLDNTTISLSDFMANLANNTDQSDVPSSPFVFPQNMTLESCAQLLNKLVKQNEKLNSYLIRGLYAPLLLSWVKRFAADDRLMVMKFNEVFNESIFDEVLRFAGVDDTSIDEHDNNFIRNNRGVIIGERDKNESDHNHAMKGRRKQNVMQGWEISLDPLIRLYLKLLYQPFNRFLVQLLGDEWEGWVE